jgi:hypothetical protein
MTMRGRSASRGRRVGDREQLGLVGADGGGGGSGHGYQSSTVLMESAPSVLSGAVALMSLSVSRSLAECDRAERNGVGLAVLDRDPDVSPSVPRACPRIACGRPRLGERDPRLVPGPVVEILEAGQRPVDAGRADLEPVAARDRVAPFGLQRVEHFRQAARNRSQSDRSSWRVSGRSAITCRVGSEPPPIIATRTSRSRGFPPRARSARHAAMSVHPISSIRLSDRPPGGPASTSSNDVEEDELYRLGREGKRNCWRKALAR